ncbi:MAG: hypothetical protein AB3X44_20805 [Leptothrix sp. (in: b-proteobacteria)]
MMKKALFLVLVGVVLAATSGCVIAPRPYRAVEAPAPVYVEPSYPSPGVGWLWEFHSTFGWGWHHPRFGWHRGWH